MSFITERVTRPGSLVVDPFSGSGVTGFAAVGLNRRYLGIDINPIAVKLSSLVLNPPSAPELRASFAEVSRRVKGEIEATYSTSTNSEPATHYLWNGDELQEVWVVSGRRRVATLHPSAFDYAMFEKYEAYRPKFRPPRFFKNSRINAEPCLTWQDLFTGRALRNIELMLDAIRNLPEGTREVIEHNLYASLRGYVLCSWYNHWTSIMIEDVFKDHPDVLPAVGLVKKIDFFVRDVPFDLKVTYLPEGYLIQKRKEAGLRPELTLLKRAARLFGIPIPTDLSSSALLQDLWTKVADHPNAACQSVVRDLHRFRNHLVSIVRNDPIELIKWLYEEQGIRRFDASNRLFLVLVDQRNYFESWKLKRAKPLLERQVGNYVDSIGERVGYRIEFNYDGDTYKAISDLIVVTNAEATD